MFFPLIRCAATLILACLALTMSAPASADMDKIRQSGSLKVAVYKDMAPFSSDDGGIDVDIADALAKKLGLKLALLPFPAGEEVGDDLRNMVWKGHYLGYGPADVMLHVPVDRFLIARNDKVEIFAPYYRETVRLAYSKEAVPRFDGLDSLQGREIGVEKVSIAGVLLLGEGDGKFRDKVRIYPTAVEALQDLKAGRLAGVLAHRSEIESVLRDDARFGIQQVAFQRLPAQGWAVGMAVKKEARDLAQALQQALAELTASGEMGRIFAKHGVQPVTP
ncbi:substrate-binding periplasmic protein [Noviherbaspirillum soli]|uniref:substrate-binding periplasmic protein n=1 Tax=Noviherbaspirillum soli TaxID=1064518 RepID=UPI00188D193D|nr:transporter substrate-binding domain-containing protein [Noviherbaspirillum soli]